MANPHANPAIQIATPVIENKSTPATALVALAKIEGNPTNTSTGKVRKDPPLATAFKMPASKAATTISI